MENRKKILGAVPKPCPGYAGNLSVPSINFGIGSFVTEKVKKNVF
jgi:hypothetical protein